MDNARADDQSTASEERARAKLRRHVSGKYQNKEIYRIDWIAKLPPGHEYIRCSAIVADDEERGRAIFSEGIWNSQGHY